MNELIGRVFDFEKTVFPNQSDLFSRLVRHGQIPKALMISCADSRIVPEQIMQAAPGELFVCRNAGNIVPPYSQANGGVRQERWKLLRQKSRSCENKYC